MIGTPAWWSASSYAHSGSSAPRKRKNGSRKLKFGSPAWRKKYSLGKKRRKK